MARTVKATKTGLLSPLPSQQSIPGDTSRVPEPVDPSKSLISPPPEETLRYGHRYSESVPDSPQPISKRKRSAAPTASRPDAITRTQSTTSTQSLDLTPNPKPRKQSRKSTMALKSIAAESPTKTTPSRSKAILIPESPHVNNPNADFIIPSAARRRSRAPLSPVPYEPPAERFTPPREVTLSPPLKSYNRASSRSKKADGTKKKVKGIMYIKTEMPDIDLTPLPPPSPTEDPLLLSGPARTTRNKKKTNHARAATTNALKGFKATYDKLAAERPPRASQSNSNATSSSPRSPTFEFDHHAPSSSSSISPIIDQDGNTKNWTFAHVPLSSDLSSFPNESIPDDVEWIPKPVPLTSSPSNASDHEGGVLPTFESALAGTYDHLNQDDGWSSDEDIISEGEGEYTGHYKTVYMPIKQDPPTSVTKTRMDEWGRPKSPFPKKSGRRRGGDEMDVEEEEEQHSDASSLKSDLLDITGEDPDADYDDVHEEDLVLADEDMHDHDAELDDLQDPPPHNDSIEEDVSMEEDDANHSYEDHNPADNDDEDDDEDEENFVDRELSREPDAADDDEDDTQPIEEQGEDTLNVSYSLTTHAPPDNDMHGQEDTSAEDSRERAESDNDSEEDDPPAHHEDDMPGQEDTSADSLRKTGILAGLDNEQEEEGVPTITIRTPSPASNPPINTATLLRSPSPHHIRRISPGPSLLSQQLAARRQSAAPSPSSHLILRQPSPVDSVIEISPPPPAHPPQNALVADASQTADFSPQPHFGPLPLHSLEDEEDSDGDLSGGGEEDESMIKITSDNPRAAARAAAILKQYDYECYTKLTLKRLNEQQQRSRSRSTSLDAFSRDARRRGLSDTGIRKSVSKSPRKQRQSIGGVIGEQVFIPGSPVTTLPNLLKEAEEDLLNQSHAQQPDLLGVVGGTTRSQSVLHRFSTPEPRRRGGSLLRRSDYDDIIASRSGKSRGKGSEEWKKEDWKLLDACFTDERMATAVRMGMGEGELAGVDDVEVGDVVRRFAEVCGIEVGEDGEGGVWSFAGICKRARALQRKQRSGNVAAPTGRFSMTPALSLSTAGSPPPQVPDFTPLASRPLPRRPVLPPPVVEDAPFKDLHTVPKVLLAPRYSHLLSEAIAVGSPSGRQQRESYEDDDSAELEYGDDESAGYDDSGEFDDDDAEGEEEEGEEEEEPRGTPGLGGKVKGFIFSYLPTLSKHNGSKIPKPAGTSKRGLPLPPKEVLNKPRGPVNTPARPPAPKVPAPRDLVHLNAAPLPIEKKKSSLPVRKPPQRLVELHPVTPKASEPIMFVPTRQRKSSTGSVKDLVRSFEKMDEEAAGKKDAWKTGSLKDLRKGRSRPGVLGASKPVWR